MFERFILTVIQLLKRITKKLDKAYYETFGDKANEDGQELSYAFDIEVRKRKFINKDFFIKNAAIFVGRKTLKEEGYIMPPEQALQIGEAMFNEAKENGEIDCLNNVINKE